MAIQPCPIKIRRVDRGVGAHCMRPTVASAPFGVRRGPRGHAGGTVATARLDCRSGAERDQSAARLDCRSGAERDQSAWAHAMRPYALTENQIP